MNIIRLNSIGEPFAKSEQATPPSGGGTEGGEEAIRYCNVLSIFGTELLAFTAAIVKCNVDGVLKFYPMGAGAVTASNIVAAGIIVSDTYEMLKEAGKSFEDAYAELESYGDIQTITKEQFYTL